MGAPHGAVEEHKMKIKISKKCPNFNIAGSVGRLISTTEKMATVEIAGNIWKISCKQVVFLEK